jgi:hypothetical protein
VADRISQVGAEAIILPTDQKARASQVGAEAIILPTDQKARASQAGAEVVIGAAAAAVPFFNAQVIG